VGSNGILECKFLSKSEHRTPERMPTQHSKLHHGPSAHSARGWQSSWLVLPSHTTKQAASRTFSPFSEGMAEFMVSASLPHNIASCITCYQCLDRIYSVNR
jgi:hypothetical protein